jgi:thiamine monophosphate kinase
MMDITDGLVQDSAKFASACNLDFYIELDQLPFFETLRQNLKIEDIIHSGEELELLILTDQEINSQFPLHLNQIGYAKKGNGKVHFTLNGVAYFPQKKGFIHFNN